MAGLILVFFAAWFTYCVVVKKGCRFNLLCKAVAVGSLLQVLSTMFVLYADPEVLGGTKSDWYGFIGLGLLNNIFFILGLSQYREKRPRDHISVGPIFVVYFILVIVRLLYPISTSEMHTEIRVSGVGEIPFVVVQLRVLFPLLTLALYLGLVRKGVGLLGLFFVLIYVLYSFYLGNRGDVFYMFVSIVIVGLSEGKGPKKKHLIVFGLSILIGLVVLSSTRKTNNESIISQGLSRLATLRVADQIVDGTLPHPNTNGLIANFVSFVPSSVFDAYGIIGQAFEFSPNLGYAAAYFNGYKGTGIAVPICYEFVWWFNPLVAPVLILIFGLCIAFLIKGLNSFSGSWALVLTLTFLPGLIGMEDMTSQFWPFFSRYVFVVSASVLLFRALWVKKSIS